MRVWLPLCYFCKHFDAVHDQENRGKQVPRRCRSFPNGIPREIINPQYDHRLPHPYDQGFQFEQYSTRETLSWYLKDFPDFALKGSLDRMIEFLEWGRKAGSALPPDTGSPEGNFLALLRLYRVTEAELDPKKHGYPPLWGLEDADPPLDFRLLFVLILDAYSKLDAETMARYPLPDFDVDDYDDAFEIGNTES